jgi:hypothetical protein
LNKDIYKDEFGQYHEVDEEVETPIDGLEDDEQDPSEEVDDMDDLFDLAEDDDEYDEDEAYASERRTEYDSEED